MNAAEFVREAGVGGFLSVTLSLQEAQLVASEIRRLNRALEGWAVKAERLQQELDASAAGRAHHLKIAVARAGVVEAARALVEEGRILTTSREGVTVDVPYKAHMALRTALEALKEDA